METITPDFSTVQYMVNTLKIPDLLPNSLKLEENKNKIQIINEESTSVNKDKDIYKLKLEKNLKANIKLSSDYSINSISSYNNLLLIACNNEIKVYDISNSFESFGCIKLKEQNKNILCMACSFIDNIVYGVVGGELASIYVFDILSLEELSGYQLIGHKNQVYQLEFHPKNPHILLSAGKDCTVRLWNFKIPELLCIFGGPYSFESDVLCIDWHKSGDYFVGAGVDTVVRIYQIDEIIKQSIEKSLKKEKVKTLLKSLPYYKCGTIHEGLIDCVKYNNKFIISKSTDGLIKEWLPFKDVNGNDSFFLVNIFVYKTKQLIVGIKFSFFDNDVVVGNELGQIFFFNKNQTEMSKDVVNNEYFVNNYTQLIAADEKNNEVLLKSVNYNSLYQIVFFGSDKGNVYIYNVQKYK